MRNRADLIVYDRQGRLALIVEAKYKFGTTREWAAHLRRNMYAHGLLPSAPFFLLALPDHFYLWKNEPDLLEPVEPTFDIDPRPFLEPYYRSLGIAPEDLTGQSFELIITSWLSQILSARFPEEQSKDGQEWLIQTGLHETLQGGSIHFELAA